MTFEGTYGHASHATEIERAELEERVLPKDMKQILDVGFLCTRIDGSQVRLRPHHGTTKVDVKLVGPHPISTPPELGGHEGPGSFKCQATASIVKTLRFDGTKSCGTGKATAKAKAKTRNHAASSSV
jgi:hypothetical protein